MKKIAKKAGRYTISESFLGLIKTLVTGKAEIAKISDKKLGEKGKKMKDSILAFEKEVKDAAKEKGISVDEYMDKYM